MAERGARPEVPAWRLRGLRALRSLFTPLLPDDYLELINPLWSTQELRGRIERDRARDRRRGDGRRSSRAGSGRATSPASTCASACRSTASTTGAPTRSPPTRTAPTAASRITPKLVERGQVSPYLVAPGRGRARSSASAASRARSRCPTRSPAQAAVHQRRQRHHADHEHAARARPPRRAGRRRPPALRAHRRRRDLRRPSCASWPRRHPRLPPARAAHRRGRPHDRRRPTSTSCAPTGASARPSSPARPRCSTRSTEHWDAARRPRPPAHRALPADHRRRRRRAGDGGTIRFRDSDVEAECDGGKPILVGRRGGRRDAAVRLPHGHLPHLRRAAALRAGPRPAHRRGPRPARARWSAPASTRPKGTSRSSSEHHRTTTHPMPRP